MARRFIALVVPGRPVPKGRPRFARGGHIYTPERTRVAEEIMQGEMRQACTTALTGPLELGVSFCFQRPKSWSKDRRAAVDDGEEPWYSGKPDISNFVKLVEDAGNGILWRDDAQIVKLDAIKVYSTTDETVINVSSLNEDSHG